jgi:hypothetical protein
MYSRMYARTIEAIKIEYCSVEKLKVIRIYRTIYGT